MESRPWGPQVLWTTLLALVGAGAACAQTYDLTARYPAGAVIEVRETQEVRVKVLSGMLRPPDGDTRRLDRATVRYRVLEDKEGFPARQEATVVSCRSTVEEPDEDPVRERSPLEGARVLVQVAPDLSRTYATAEGAPIDPEQADCCDHLPAGLTAGLNLAAVAVGSEWTLPAQVARQALGLGEGGGAEVKLRFAEVVTEAGHPTAKIAVSVSTQRAPAADGAPQVRSQYAGEFFLDLQTHLPRFFTAKGSVHLVVAGAGENGADLVLEGPMAMTVFYEPLPQMAPGQ